MCLSDHFLCCPFVDDELADLGVEGDVCVCARVCVCVCVRKAEKIRTEEEEDGKGQESNGIKERVEEERNQSTDHEKEGGVLHG